MARELRRRDKRVKKTNSVILFGVEGDNQTEKIYFSHFQKRDNPFNIQFVKGTNTDPINIVTSTIRYMEKNDIKSEYGDKIYCLFDGDYNENGKDKQSEINEAYKLAKKYNIEVILSIPSFELWLLLHFEYTTHAFTSNKDLINYLKRHINNYDKNLDVFESVEALIDDAIKNAKRLKKHFGIDDESSISGNEYNPTTDVYKIIEYMREKQKNI